MNRVDLYRILTNLLPTQFDEVLFIADVPREHLPSREAPQAERALAVIQWAEISDDNWDALISAVLKSGKREPKPVAKSAAAPAAAAADPVAKLSLPITAPGAGLASRSPIVIAIEERDAPLKEDELLNTERHVTVALSAGQLDTLADIDFALRSPLPLEDLVKQGRRAWQALLDAQKRLKSVFEKVWESDAPQPIAWTGRTSLLLRVHRALAAAYVDGRGELNGFLSIGCGAHYFSPIAGSSGQWTIQPRAAAFKVGVLEGHGEREPVSVASAGTTDVAIVLDDEVTLALRSLADAAATGWTRVAVGIGRADLSEELLHAVLSRVPCLSIGGPTLRQDLLVQTLVERFTNMGATQAAPCILAAARQAWMAQAARDRYSCSDALLWTTWCWIGRPLFANRFGEHQPAAVKHLMDLRSVAGKDWYVNRTADILPRYLAKSLAGKDSKEKFHLYLSGAGGTGKSCFLRNVHDQLAERTDVIPVWYRVDAPNSSWPDVQLRIRDEIVRAAEKYRLTLPERLHEGDDLLAGLDKKAAILVSELRSSESLGNSLRDAAERIRAMPGTNLEIVIFIDQLERTFESGDEPNPTQLREISDEVISLLETVKCGEGVRVFIASRKQYLPDFLNSFEAASTVHLHFNLLHAISHPQERSRFVTRVVEWCEQQNLINEGVRLKESAVALIADQTRGHPLNMMLALIQLLSQDWHDWITEEMLRQKTVSPWDKLFDLDLRVMGKDDLDRYFVMAMAQARTEIVRFEDVWWRLRMVDPTLTRKADELRGTGLLERLWLSGHLGRTIHLRTYETDSERYLEFFHANLRDYLLGEVMGQGGGDPARFGKRWRTPATWRALERLSALAHEWEQTQERLPYDDIKVLVEHRDVVIEKATLGKTEVEPFYLLFLRDADAARKTLCRAARECFAFSALVHDESGRRSFETLFDNVEDRVETARKWLQRCSPDMRAPILRYLIESKAAPARDALTAMVIPDAQPLGDGLSHDLAVILSEPLHAARFRPELLAAVMERAILRTPAASRQGTAAPLPAAVGPFFAVACGCDRNELSTAVSNCTGRLEASSHDRVRNFAAALSAPGVVDAWLESAPTKASLQSPLENRERQGKVPPAVHLILGKTLGAIVKDARAEQWRTELRNRLGIPLPKLALGTGEVSENELELHLGGDRVALGTFYPDRVRILQRHWDRTQHAMPPDARDTQDDALQEVVYWVDKDLLAQTGWELPAHDFDRAVVDWLEVMLRNSISRVFSTDLAVEFVNEIATSRDSSRLFQGIPLHLLQEVLENLVHERVPLTERRHEIVEELQQSALATKDPEILTQKVREHVKDDLCRALSDDSGQLATVLLGGGYEASLLRQLGRTNEGLALLLDPAKRSALASAVSRQFEPSIRDDLKPVIVCDRGLRLPLLRLLREFDPRILVLSFTELSTEVILVPAGLLEEPKASAA